MKKILTALILFMTITCFGQNLFSDNYVTATSDSLNTGYTNAELIITVDQTGKYTRALPLDTLDKHYMLQSSGATAGIDLWQKEDTIIIGSAPALDSFNTVWFYPLADNGAASDSLLISTAQYRCTGTTVDFNISIFADDTINSSTPSDTIIYNFNVTDESGDLINITTLNDLILEKDKVAYWKGESFTVAPDWFMITLFGSRLNRTY